MKLGLAGDTMLGRLVADRLATDPPEALFDEGVVAAAREADAFLLNLECAVSDRGERWPDPDKPFFFRAPPVAVEALRLLGVDCVTLANNHALDYGVPALLDTLAHLDAAGIAHTGAGRDEEAARVPARLDAGGVRLGVIGVSDHPPDFAAGPDRAGIAYADLGRGVPGWLGDTIAGLDTDIVVVTPHWGPNMTTEPLGYVRRAAVELRAAGATLVAGHSAHAFHGVADGVLYDLGDFIDDYAVDPALRNDLGLIFLVTFEAAVPVLVEAVPIAIEVCRTRLADQGEAAWIERRFRDACARLGTAVFAHRGRLVVEPAGRDAPPPAGGCGRRIRAGRF